MVTGKEKALSAMSYFSLLFLLIAYLANDKKSEFVNHHIMQGLVLQLISIFGFIIFSAIGNNTLMQIFGVMVWAFLIWGVVLSFKGKATDIPVLNLYKRFKK